MGKSVLAQWTPTKSYSAVTTRKEGICLHHYAAVGDNLAPTFNNRNVSAHYSVGNNGTIRQYVDDDQTAYATGTTLGNAKFVNIEVSNSGGPPDWPVSDLVIKKVIDLIAEIAKRKGIYPLVPGRNLRQHKQFVATYCAGRVGDALDVIAKEVNRIIGANGGPPFVSDPPGALSYPIVRKGSTGDFVRIVQRAVGAVDDGIFGGNTYKAVCRYQATHRFVVDGIVGPVTWTAILGSCNADDHGAMVLPGRSKPVLRVGSRGYDVKVVQKIVGVADDGVFGNVTSAAVKAYQLRKGLVADGVVGEKTWAAMGYQ